jgi:hypothetical protein
MDTIGDESHVKELGLCAAGYLRRWLDGVQKPCIATILAHLRAAETNG